MRLEKGSALQHVSELLIISRPDELGQTKKRRCNIRTNQNAKLDIVYVRDYSVAFCSKESPQSLYEVYSNTTVSAYGARARVCSLTISRPDYYRRVYERLHRFSWVKMEDIACWPCFNIRPLITVYQKSFLCTCSFEGLHSFE